MDATMTIMLDYLKEKINSNEDFLKAVKGWNAKILTRIYAKGIPYEYPVLMTIKNGKCAKIELLETSGGVKADFIVEMDITTYEAILRGEMSSARAFLTGKIKIYGRKRELMKRMGALNAMVEEMRKILFEGEAVKAIAKLMRRIATF